jgi:hypothetical protein
LAAYADVHGLLEELAFAWWAPHTIKKHDQIIKAVKKAHYWKCMHKWGIRVPQDGDLYDVK